MPGKRTCTCARKGAPSEAELAARLEAVLADYRKKPGGLIPALQTIQAIYGYLPGPVLSRVAEAFDKPLSEVAGVVSFYSFFSTVPRGKYLVRVCLGTACYVRGGNEVLQALKRRLGIDVGETTPDRQFSLEVGRCFGACGMAPAVMINDELHQRVKPAKIGALLESCRDATAASAKETA
jgi:NADH:ubiquinone oxidoreductase subunit E